MPTPWRVTARAFPKPGGQRAAILLKPMLYIMCRNKIQKRMI
jgi:hypothetical protein